MWLTWQGGVSEPCSCTTRLETGPQSYNNVLLQCSRATAPSRQAMCIVLRDLLPAATALPIRIHNWISLMMYACRCPSVVARASIAPHTPCSRACACMCASRPTAGFHHDRSVKVHQPFSSYMKVSSAQRYGPQDTSLF